jgi:hypothetical protein
MKLEKRHRMAYGVFMSQHNMKRRTTKTVTYVRREMKKRKSEKLKRKLNVNKMLLFFYHRKTLSTQQNCICAVAGLFLKTWPVIIVSTVSAIRSDKLRQSNLCYCNN